MLFILKGMMLWALYSPKIHDMVQIAGWSKHRSANSFHNFEGNGSGFLALAYCYGSDTRANLFAGAGYSLVDASTFDSRKIKYGNVFLEDRVFPPERTIRLSKSTPTEYRHLDVSISNSGEIIELYKKNRKEINLTPKG
jgi:hypothetical protein